MYDNHGPTPALCCGGAFLRAILLSAAMSELWCGSWGLFWGSVQGLFWRLAGSPWFGKRQYQVTRCPLGPRQNDAGHSSASWGWTPHLSGFRLTTWLPIPLWDGFYKSCQSWIRFFHCLHLTWYLVTVSPDLSVPNIFGTKLPVANISGN